MFNVVYYPELSHELRGQVDRLLGRALQESIPTSNAPLFAAAMFQARDRDSTFARFFNVEVLDTENLALHRVGEGQKIEKIIVSVPDPIERIRLLASAGPFLSTDCSRCGEM